MNEYGLTPLRGVISATKMRNALRALDPTLIFDLRNININGRLMGCSGFITDPATGNIVYLSTEDNPGPLLGHAVYRTAKHTKDYSGGLNHMCLCEDLPTNVIELLRKTRTLAHSA